MTERSEYAKQFAAMLDGDYNSLPNRMPPEMRAKIENQLWVDDSSRALHSLSPDCYQAWGVASASFGGRNGVEPAPPKQRSWFSRFFKHFSRGGLQKPK